MGAAPPPPASRVRRSHRRALHLSLRARITLGFTLGALVLSSAIAGITYFTTRSQIVSQQLTAFQKEALAGAGQLDNMVTGSTPVDPLLAILTIDEAAVNASPTGATSTSTTPPAVAFYYSRTNASWTNANPEFTSLLPRSLKARVASFDEPAYQVFNDGGNPWVAVAVPVPDLRATFVESFSLEQTARTLRIILVALAVAGLVTTLAGAVVGRWAAGFALRPLREVSQAALAIASGRLGTRLETGDAPDLAVLASSFNRMVDRLQQRIERDARFTSDVSHELRSPLTTLATSLSVIEARRDELPERSRQALQLVSDEVRRFQRMVGELLEISRLDAGSADFQASVVPVGEVLRRSVSTSSREPIPLEIDPAVESRKVIVDKRRFERILANLIENAERYAGAAIKVTATARDSSVRIGVEDAGPGIPPSERERIFERFARGSVAAGSRGTGGGTGLGLALVLEHVKLHGGRVWVEGREEGGSRFVIELPLAPPGVGEDANGETDAGDEPVASSPKRPGRGGERGRSATGRPS
ncbi:MAG: HAMP domain-containing sensor histidine kinase [Actinomycetota bacterium]|nr:HAMP domain-containing sensor histidine kinase [Actinomycetota bacterium]